jgi:hypothetical protein
VWCGLAALWFVLVAAAPVVPDSARVAEIGSLLPAEPAGTGPRIDERSAWNELARQPKLARVVEEAEKLVAKPLEDQPDELYLEFSRSGNRSKWQDVAGRRRKRLNVYVLAECIENKGRFIKLLEELIGALCEEKTWVLPAHDKTLEDFNGTAVSIDLWSSLLGWNLAMADHLLGERLSPETRRLLRAEVGRRVLDPYERTIETGKGNGWMKADHNWNAVCHAGVIGAVLALEPDRARRALFVASAERKMRPYLGGFTADGYCSEGLGYWNYGFGHFILLTETVRQAAGGKIDFFTLPGVAAPARFPRGIEIVGGISPAFADCSLGVQPGERYLGYAAARLGTDTAGGSDPGEFSATSPLGEVMIFARPEVWEKSPVAPAGGSSGGFDPLRSWFGDAGILICRMAEGTAGSFGAALKGGHNAELHNHNDLGSYVVVVGTRPVLLDPGSEVYTARTFSKRRYESKLLNSWGHPVPVVAGQLQRTGREAAARVVNTEFTPERDTLVLDITSAYEIPALRKLERAFEFRRGGKGALTVTDTAEFSEPSRFETALVTLGDWIQEAPDRILVHDGESMVRVRIDTGGAAFTFKPERIEEDSHAPSPPLRLGIVLDPPATAAKVALEIVPVEFSEAFGEGGLLGNGGFEHGALGWSIPGNGLGCVNDEDAASGKYSLRITDTSEKNGSNITSPAVTVKDRKDYLVKGRARIFSGGGIGIYVHCYDKSGRQLLDDKGEKAVAAIGKVPADGGGWRDFAFPFQTPKGTSTVRLWLHSFSTSIVDACLDDFEVVAD